MPTNLSNLIEPPKSLIKNLSSTNALGASVEFANIPTWSRRVTVIFNGVSSNGTSGFLLQIGGSSNIETTNYRSTGLRLTTGSGIGGTSSSTGFDFGGTLVSAAYTWNGYVILTTSDNGNTWYIWGGIGTGSVGDDRTSASSGIKALSGGPLNRLRITSVNGTDQFDAGSFTVLYE